MDFVQDSLIPQLQSMSEEFPVLQKPEQYHFPWHCMAWMDDVYFPALLKHYSDTFSRDHINRSNAACLRFELNYFDPNINHFQLLRDSVSVHPFVSFYGHVLVGQGTVIYPGTVIRGPCIIGHNCVIGSQTELKHVIVCDNTHISHQSMILDSVIGQNCRIGGRFATVNNDQEKAQIPEVNYQDIMVWGGFPDKYGVTIEDNCVVGGNCITQAGAYMSEGYRLPGSAYLSRTNVVSKMWKGERVLSRGSDE